MQKCQETAAPEWLTVLITKASLASFKLYRFSSFKTLHLVIFLLFFSWLFQYNTFSSKVSDCIGSVADRHFMTSGRICTVWSCILLGKDCFLQIAQLCLSWIKFNEIHNLQSDCICQSGWIHYTDKNFSCCIFLFLSFPLLLFSLSLLSPHTLSFSPLPWAILCVKTYHTMPCRFSGKNKWNSTHHHPKHANAEMLEGLVPNESAAIWR